MLGIGQITTRIAELIRGAMPYAIVNNGTNSDGTPRPISSFARLVSYTTVQGAFLAREKNIHVKAGVHPGFTVSTNDVLIQLEPGTVVEAAIILSGNNVTLRVGAGCDIQGIVTISGDGCSFICEDGCDIDGIICSGDGNRVDGGGWGTLSHGGSNTAHGIDCSGSRNIVSNMSFQTLGGIAGTYMAIYVRTGTFNTVRNCRVIDADAGAIYVASADNLIVDNVVMDADEDGIFVAAARNRIIGNYVVQSVLNHGCAPMRERCAQNVVQQMLAILDRPPALKDAVVPWRLMIVIRETCKLTGTGLAHGHGGLDGVSLTSCAWPTGRSMMRRLCWTWRKAVMCSVATKTAKSPRARHASSRPTGRGKSSGHQKLSSPSTMCPSRAELRG